MNETNKDTGEPVPGETLGVFISEDVTTKDVGPGQPSENTKPVKRPPLMVEKDIRKVD